MDSNNIVPFDANRIPRKLERFPSDQSQQLLPLWIDGELNV